MWQTSSLVASGSPALVGSLYAHLLTMPEYQSVPSRLHLSNRLRECLLKSWVITGIAPVLGAFFALVKAEKAADVETEAANRDTER